MNSQSLIYLIISSLSTVLAQTLFKFGSRSITIEYNLITIKNILTSPLLIISIIFYVTASITWVKVLTVSELSIAFPVFVAIVFILIMIVSVLVFGEKMSIYRIIGIAILFIGIITVLKS